MPRVVLAAALFACLGACSGGSSSPTPGPADTGAADTGGGVDASVDTSVDDTGVVDDTGTTEDVAPDLADVPPVAPKITSLMKMGANIHVFWDIVETGPLTAVELWRNQDGAGYVKAYTLPGTTNNKHDTGAVGPGKFCYQVYNVRGALKSPASNEKCGTL